MEDQIVVVTDETFPFCPFRFPANFEIDRLFRGCTLVSSDFHGARHRVTVTTS
jgi:hypothetical protein